MNLSKQAKLKIIIVLGIIVIIVLVIFILLQKQQNIRSKTINSQQSVNSNSQIQNQQQSKGKLGPSLSAISNKKVAIQEVKTAQAVATGSSLVTSNNIVVTPQGTPVKLNVVPASSQAPKESIPLQAKQIKNTANTVRMSISAAGFVPNTFTVKAGQLVNFVLTSTDNYTHVFMFDNPSLTAAVLGVAGHETREKSWNAPKPGVYPFKCAVPGHAARGEVGKMIVIP